MKLTERDYELLYTIYQYDGLLSVDQVHRWFFGAKRRAYYRIRALCDTGCLQRLDRQEMYRVPEPIVWLGKSGAQIVADRVGVEYDDLRWRNTPRWSRVSHDIALNEARHMFEVAFATSPHYVLETWKGQEELEFIFPNPIPYLDLNRKQKQKLVRPDGYFSLLTQYERSTRVRFLVELDNNSESNKRFGRDKVSPNVHLMLSPYFQQELGGQSGRVIVITVGSEKRFHHLRTEVKQAGGAAYFLFTRYEWMKQDNLLGLPIFYVAHLDKPFSFQEYHSSSFQVALGRSLASAPDIPLLYR